ncbi:Uncharacterized protein Fot_17708 [Forsythia ovata]|uniref:Cytochrome P450 n=1 Tax=Forsythia ovata TaxID=205694 RepID=A0ABD1VGH0_9LAMI
MNEGVNMDLCVLGSDLKLAPFGSGRRVCPGKTLGLTTVTFWVASLLHEFEFRPCNERSVDLSELLKLSCEMVNPLSVREDLASLESITRHLLDDSQALVSLEWLLPIAAATASNLVVKGEPDDHISFENV